MRDFSRTTKPIEFTADGDSFKCTPGVAAGLIGDIVADIQSAKDVKAQMNFITEFFEMVLEDDSAELFTSRLRDKHNPIDIGQALDIVSYVTEEIGKRPTPPSQSSSDGSATEATGTSSTAGAPSEVSIPLDSPLIGSATSFTVTS